MWRNPSHPDRPLHAIVQPPGPALFAAVRDALSGDGPAVLPLSPGHAGAAVAALRPTHADGVPLHGGEGVPGDVAVVIATSGSTGAPKGVLLSAAALRASAAASLRRVEAAEGERWLCCLPVAHVSGLQVLVRALLSGSEPIIHPAFDPGAVLRSGADHVSLVPTQLHRLVEAGADLSVFRTIVLGGAAAPPGLLERARERGARIVTTYGSSETSGGCVYDGRPLDGVDVKIGEDGLIRIAGPVLFSGYRFGVPAAPFDGGWFVTSDLGELREGRLRVLGRADDVINTGGEKVVAGAVTDVLRTHPEVADAAVIGTPDREWGELVTAVVVPANPGTPPTLEQLRAYCRDRLPPHAAPRDLRLVPALPLLPNGKTDLVRLRAGT
ncbi:O-succinylbenzoic acid--CoA ligase [[Actinomadura] parvosata subsp. kistnae]|uniref:AMP-dependent synthetase n=1 Tax=[Actinomadura] parvosata subsp. kistnae TaxID=1909395 RepID=A0A1V0A1K8_9ACTN|nr:AMP-binding protein [Nonomuraea sp. ATCC 55076]AQZ64073.1 AMP-dependent synthetase [Nonomuraea sp. ATCC 55076]SPL89967.1 O-succinylbenzoic acid--CoA ligase [Actinomadura parvosata subsp. kistnae]